ncbi:unnamed protein product [Closterium sp. NIES-54]
MQLISSVRLFSTVDSVLSAVQRCVRSERVWTVRQRSGEGRSGEGRSGHVLIYTATAAAAAAAVVAAAAAVARDLPLDRRSYGSATRSEIATAT